MSAEETKPTVSDTPAAPAVDSTLPPPAAESTTTPAPVVDAPAVDAKPDTTAAPAADTPAAAAAPAEDKKTEKKPAEPIYSGSLNYQAQSSGPAGSIKAVFQGPKKRFFWFGEEAPITTQHLNNFLRGEKPKAAHPAAAWSNKTGKGLLYFVKNADEKANPAGVIVLADATDVEDSHGPIEFSFKVDGVKHVFQTKTADERAGWVAALKKVVEEAKASKEEVVNSTEYKDAMSNLNKPVTAGLAATSATGAAAKTDSSKETPKPSTDKPADAAAVAEDKPAEEKKDKKASKSRSVSRGKRTSIFGTIMGKKEESEEKKEEKKEEKAEAKKEDAAVPAATTEPTAPAATETKAEEPAIAAATTTPATTDSPTAEKKPEDAKEELAKAGKTNKRGSIFGQFFEKVRSPTTEKKESEVTPTVPPKDEGKDKELPVAPATETPAAVEAAPVVAAEPATTAGTAPVAIPGAEKKEEKAEEKKLSSSTPKDKESFFSKLKGRTEKIRSPSSETPPAAKDAPKEETPASTTEVAPVAETTPAVTEAKPEETPAVVAGEESKTNGVTADKKDSSPTEKRRTSLFGGFGGSTKKDKATSDSEKEGGSQKLSGIFRNPSKLIKGQKEGKKGAAPSKVDEETKVSDEAPKLDKPAETAPLSEETKAVEDKPQNSIGDVVPEAVQVGQPPAATPAVSATA